MRGRARGSLGAVPLLPSPVRRAVDAVLEVGIVPSFSRVGYEVRSRVEHWQARSIVIESDVPQPSQLDGDPIGEASTLHVRIDPGALVMRVPVPPSPSCCTTSGSPRATATASSS